MNDGFAGVYGGQQEFKYLTPTLLEKDYAVLKIKCWLKMLNGNSKPTRWLKPNTKGTKVNFKTIKTKEEWNQCFEELMNHISEMNEKHGLDMKLERNEASA